MSDLYFYNVVHKRDVFILCGSVRVDLSVGSSDRYTDGEDFDRTHQVDHLALLGTAPSVSARVSFL